MWKTSHIALRGRGLRCRLQIGQDYFPTYPCCLSPIDRPVFRFPAAFCKLRKEGAVLVLLFVARKLPSLESQDLNQGRLGNFSFQQAALCGFD